jgi:hypothetical protein
VHSTFYEVGPKWNADIYNAGYREAVDVGSLANQASVFNGIGQVWAPHYRQMKLDGYYTNDSALKAQAYVAFDSAYQDVRRAFLRFIEFSPRVKPMFWPRTARERTMPSGSSKKSFCPMLTCANACFWPT